MNELTPFKDMNSDMRVQRLRIWVLERMFVPSSVIRSAPFHSHLLMSPFSLSLSIIYVCRFDLFFMHSDFLCIVDKQFYFHTFY